MIYKWTFTFLRCSKVVLNFGHNRQFWVTRNFFILLLFQIFLYLLLISETPQTFSCKGLRVKSAKKLNDPKTMIKTLCPFVTKTPTVAEQYKLYNFFLKFSRMYTKNTHFQVLSVSIRRLRCVVFLKKVLRRGETETFSQCLLLVSVMNRNFPKQINGYSSGSFFFLLYYPSARLRRRIA